MKNLLKLSAIFALLISCSFSSFAQTTPAESEAKVKISNLPVESKFVVHGVCNACKKRIEKAAYIKGVKLAEWDKAAQLLSVIYRADKVSLEEIQKAVASAGHDTAEVKGDNTAYSKLPGCCQYRDGIEIH